MKYFLSILFLLFSMLLMATAQAEYIVKRPNVVLIMADDLGWGDVGYNNNPAIKTPNLDTMAANGLRMNRFYSAAPVCSPTRGSVMTGRHPFRYGIVTANAGSLPREEHTLPELLKATGYRTGHFGKWHIGTLTQTVKDSNRGGRKRFANEFSPPWQHGIDVSFATESRVPTLDPMRRPADNKFNNFWWDSIKKGEESHFFGAYYWTGQDQAVDKDSLHGDDTKLLVDRVIPFINQSVADNTPFLAVIWLHSPHLPLVASDADREPFKTESKYNQHYKGSVLAMDREIGRLRRALRTAGIADNTLVWFSSDNGPEGSNEAPGRAGGLKGRKRSLYEGGVRVPSLLEWPSRIKAGLVSDMPAVSSDVLPTLLEELGLNYPSQHPLDGISLSRVLDGKQTQRNAPIGFQTVEQLVWMEDRYKLVSADGPVEERLSRWARKAIRKKVKTADLNYELYDIVADPNETTNIAAKHPKRVAAMVTALTSWRASVKHSATGQDYH